MKSNFRRFIQCAFGFFIICLVGFAQIPVITAIDPLESPVNERISITGIDLGSIIGVSFGSTEADINSILNSTNTDFSILVPNVGIGNVDVVVTTPGGISTAYVFTIVSPPITAPTILGVNVSEGEVDDFITISGQHLLSITSISFGSTSADISTLVYIDAQTIAVQIPLVNLVGDYPIKLYASLGNSNLYPFTINGLNIPKITAVEPLNSLSDLFATISGNNFTTITGVLFGNTPADLSTFAAIDGSSFAIKIPSLPVGSHAITVETSRGTSSPFNFIISSPAPTISSFTPAELKVGEKITITGTNFTLNSYVTFNIVSTTGIRLISSTLMEVTAPNGLATGILKVTTPYGTATGDSSVIVNEDPGTRGTLTGIASLQENGNLVIFPNPIVDNLYINNLPNETTFLVYDLMGQVVLSGISVGVINFSTIKNGAYFLKLHLNPECITRKIVVQKSPE